ncbi:MAG: NADH/ubiquinone/plastoquinone (complex I), partial [Candidatus Eisenbacteria bacterium]|nr:NADH/ubiquinone/plastoquinone (complex I) [Candidatus Eisenbacteria bacterium]
VDGMTRLMLLTTNLVTLASLVFSLDYMRRFTSVGLYYSMLMLMVAGMNGVIVSGDLFNVYVFLEVAAISSYGLVAFGTEHEELEASFKYLILGSVSSLFILLGIGVLYNLTGQLNMAQVAKSLQGMGSNRAATLAAAFFLMGFGLKAALVPFHAWLPDAHPSAPAPISAMLSGVLIKASGIYAMTRIVFNVLGPSASYANVLIILGALSMVVGVFLAVGQWDFKRLLGYHSISQMGYIVLAIGAAAHVMSPRGNGDPALAGLLLFGGLFHLFNHAAFKSLLFLSSGSLEQQAGTRMLKNLGGMRHCMPVTSFCCRIGALSIAGVPPFNGFFSKLIIVVGLALAGQWLLAALAVFVAMMTLVSFLKVQRAALEGEVPEHLVGRVLEAPYAMRAAMLFLAAVCTVGGPLVVWLRGWLLDPAAASLLAQASGYAALFAPGGLP